MPSKKGVEIDHVRPDSAAKESGLRPGDALLSINSHTVYDVVDYLFYASSDTLDIEFSRHGNKHSMKIVREGNGDIGLTFKPFRVKTCKNNCIFCFVKQLPKGLRKSLYIKDEDYRLSFLYGNYITATNLDYKDRKRIVDQKLSPLYISVHTTNKSLRNRMLGNPRAPDILKELKYFADRKIRMHIQIVLCPGYNDRQELKKTIRNLYKFYPYVASIAVVPVGLTRHKKHTINAVTREDALKALDIVETFQKRFLKKHGDSVVYCSDEMYLTAEHAFPKLSRYGSLPQIENGVGMVPLFFSEVKKVTIPQTVSRKKRFLTFTGTSFYPYLKKFTDRLLEKENIHIDAVPIENDFFGTSVTVTGLLTGRDIIRSLQDHSGSYHSIIVPDVTLKEDADIFLDNVTLKDIEDALGTKAVKCESTPQGLLEALVRTY